MSLPRYLAISLLKLVSLDTGKFDPDLWKGDHHTIVFRQTSWIRFLQQYDLIGMPREKVIELLGSGVGHDKIKDRYTYALAYYCTGGSFVVVQMKNNKVESWCLFDGDKQASEWHTNDVVIDADSLAVTPKSK